MKSNHCGFEAPVRGKVLQQGSFEMGENGNLVLTKTGAYSIAKKMLEYIYCCTEYKTAFLFNSIRNKVKRTCVISKSHATVIDEEEYMKLNEEPVRIFFIDKEGKFTEMDDISFCYPQDDLNGNQTE